MTGKDFAYCVWLEPETKHVVVSDIPHLVAVAMHGFPGLRDASQDMAYGATCLNLEEEVSDAALSGTLKVRNPQGLGLHNFPVGDALQRAVVCVADLGAYLEERGIEVRVMRRFDAEACPKEIPADLMAVNPAEVVRFVMRLGKLRSEGNAKASDLVQCFQWQIDRQRDGFYTANEAAELLAAAQPNADAIRFVERLESARLDGKGILRSPADRMRLENSNRPPILLDECLVTVADVDAWLAAEGVSYRFPRCRSIDAQIAPPTAREPAKKRRERLLEQFETEETERGKWGALARVFRAEKLMNPRADRSNIGADIKKAKEERKEARRAGALPRLP